MRLSEDITDEAACIVIAKLLYLRDQDPARGIVFEIDSRGGNLAAGLAIYETVKEMQPRVTIRCTGRCAGAALLVIMGAAKNNRHGTSSSHYSFVKPMLPAPSLLATEDVVRVRNQMLEILSAGTGMSTAAMEEAVLSERTLSAAEACQHGIIGSFESSP